MNGKRNIGRGTKAQRYSAPVVTILAGAIISFIGFTLALSLDRQMIRSEFEKGADNRFETIKREIESNLHAVVSLKAFFDSTPDVDRFEFRDFAGPHLSLLPSIQAIEWIPRVPHFERMAYEAAARRQTGLSNFQITERETHGKMVRAAERDEYFPVYFVEPSKGNEIALGFDLASNAIRKDALEKSRDTGEMVATGRITLVQETAGQFGFLVFAPVYRRDVTVDSIKARRENLKGFVLGVFRIGDIVERSLTRMKPKGIDTYIYDKSADSPDQSFLYFHPARTGKTTFSSVSNEEAAPNGHLENARTFDFANREWLILLKSTPGFVSAGKTWQPWGILTAGLLLTAIFAIYFIMQRRTDRMDEQLNFQQTLLNTIPSPIFYKDIDGVYLGCNSAFEAYIGRSKADIVGKTVYDVAPRELADVYRSADLALFDTPGIQQYDALVRYADGSPHDIIFTKATFSDSQGKVAGMVGVMLDITERKATEAAILESEAKFRSYVQDAPLAVFVVDREGRILDFNRSSVDLLGYEAFELARMNIAKIHPDEDREIVLQDFATLLDKGHVEIERRVKRADGQIRWVALTATMISDQFSLGYCQDITDRKRAEEERTRIENQLQQAQKMEALGTLAGGIAHDFNNILGIIMGFTQLAEYELGKGSPVLDKLDEVLKATNRAKDLVKQILAFSRRSEQQKMPLQLGIIVKEAMKILRPSLPSTIEIKADVSSKAVILADPTQIHQVLMNLCSNAAHAMRDHGGILEVGLADVEFATEPPASRESLQPGRYVELTVRDSGHGIDESIIDLIFDPFFTTKKLGEGTGLGLSVVHGVVKSHGGDIRVESTPGKGTTFKVLIPALETDHVPEKAGADMHLPRGRERVLVVDDEPSMAELVKQMLEQQGYDVVSRTSGIEALEAFRHQPAEKPFDLVVTDMTMPHFTGMDLARELSRLGSPIPVILMTGFSNQVDADRAKEMGIQGFLMKPVAMKELAATVRTVLDKRSK